MTLLPLLDPSMVVLLDRALDATAFLSSSPDRREVPGARQVDPPATGADPPVRRFLPLRPPRPAGTHPRRGTDRHGADGSRVRDRYRLITTLLDHHRHPAAELVQLYHERWRIEIAYLALRHTILDGHVLRSQDRPGLEQEVWALLTVYQLLRMAMITAVESRADTNPDRASFTTALQAARDQLIAADGIVLTDQPHRPGQPDFLGRIGRAVLATLLPPRRLRWSTRRLKNATSRYLNRNDRRPHRPTTIASIDVTLHTPNIDQTWRPRHRKPRNPQPAPTRRDIITALMEDDPSRPWRGRELADKLRGIASRSDAWRA